MAKDNRIRMPSSGGGLVTFYSEYRSKIQFKPGHIIFMIILVIVLLIFLHVFGKGLY